MNIVYITPPLHKIQTLAPINTAERVPKPMTAAQLVETPVNVKAIKRISMFGNASTGGKGMLDKRGTLEDKKTTGHDAEAMQ